MNDVITARALHVLAIVIWVGGVSMATTVVLPALRRGDLGSNWLRVFQAIEHRFVWQARTAVLSLTGERQIGTTDDRCSPQSSQTRSSRDTNSG